MIRSLSQHVFLKRALIAISKCTFKRKRYLLELDYPMNTPFFSRTSLPILKAYFKVVEQKKERQAIFTALGIKNSSL